ncbi:hypothetical protein J7K24_02175 [bacterium]|nr:hypothetical protein [bacterium]
MKNILEIGDFIFVEFRWDKKLGLFKKCSDHILDLIESNEIPEEIIKHMKKYNAISGYYMGLTDQEKLLGIGFTNDPESSVIRFYPLKDIKSITRFRQVSENTDSVLKDIIKKVNDEYIR